MNPIFRSDSYKQEIETVVTTVAVHDGCSAISCRDLLFFPAGGGQPDDHGVVNFEGRDYLVRHLLKSKGDVQLVLESLIPNLAKGQSIECRLLWPRRFRAMRLHTGQHALAAAARQIISGYATRGMTINDAVSQCRMTFFSAGEVILERHISAMLEIVRAAIIDDLTVTMATHPHLDAAQSAYGPIFRHDPRLQFKGNVRVVVIDQLDANPCGGTHVRSASEIGDIEIKGVDFKGETSECRIDFSLVDLQ